MLRFFAIATVVVVTIAVLATAYVRRDLIRGALHGEHVPATPRPGNGVGIGGAARDRGLVGDAPWALSALPDCLLQVQEAHGSLAFLRANLPAGVVPVASSATLVYGPCTISYRDGEAWVRRGNDRLRIPPLVRFYRSARRLVLLRTVHGTGELRIYERPPQR